MPIVYQHLGSRTIRAAASQSVPIVGQAKANIKLIVVTANGTVAPSQTAAGKIQLRSSSSQTVPISGGAGAQTIEITTAGSGIIVPAQTASGVLRVRSSSSQAVPIAGSAKASEQTIIISGSGAITPSQVASGKIVVKGSSAQAVPTSGQGSTITDTKAQDNITDDDLSAIDDGNDKTARIFNSSGTEIGSGSTSKFTGTSTSIDNSSELRWTNSSGSSQTITDITIEDQFGTQIASGSIGSYTVADGRDLYYLAGDLQIDELQ